MTALGFLAALAIGLLLGLLGGGGSVLTTPALMYIFGLPIKTAIVVSLVVVGVTSLAGVFGHWRHGHVQLRVALVFGGIAMVSAYGGAKLAALISGSTQLVLLATVMIVSAISMLLRSRRKRVSSDASDVVEPQRIVPAQIIPAAILVGMMTGLIGIGGGFLIVPALVTLVRLPMKHAVGTSLLIIAMNSTSGLVGYFGSTAVPWLLAVTFTTIAIGGVLISARLIRFVQPATLSRAFAVLLICVGGLMLYQRHASLHAEPTGNTAPTSESAR